MKKYIIKNSHKGKKGDITLKLQSIISEMRDDEEEKIIEFEKGEYHFYADFCDNEVIYASNTDSDRFPEKKTAINIDGIKNLIFDGGNSNFIMHGKMIAVKVSHSENIILRNFIWDFPCAATLEMKLMKKGLFTADYQLPENCGWHICRGRFHWYEKSPFDGSDYWHNIGQKESYCVVVSDEESGNLSRYSVSDGPFALCTGLRKTGRNTVRVYSLRPLRKEFTPGKIFEICADRKRDCVGSLFLESRNITAENIGVRYMHGFGWLTQMCENVTFSNCDFTPDKSSDRKSTSFADLIHVSGAKGKVHIENCRFSNAHDDPINIHGTFTVVRKKIDDYTLLCEYAHNQQNGFQQYHEGDKVIFCLRDNLQSFQQGRAFTVKSVVNPLEDGLGVKQMKVTFTEILPDEICVCDKYAVENITYSPQVYIGGCHFSSIPTRGILCTVREKAMIENNIFDGMTMASIYLSDDCNDWYESGAINDMTIRNNIFYVKKPPVEISKKPAIFVEPIVKNEKSSVESVHKNITIENNTFYLQHSNAVDCRLTENLKITGNKIYSFSEQESTLKAFNISKCKNVTVENNESDGSISLDV